MAHVILDERDQKFVLYEMLGREKLCGHQRYADFSCETLDMILAETQKFAAEEILPTPKEAVRGLPPGKGAGACMLPPYLKLFCETGWNAVGFPAELGRQGLPHLMRVAANDRVLHNLAFMAYPGLSAALLHQARAAHGGRVGQGHQERRPEHHGHRRGEPCCFDQGKDSQGERHEYKTIDDERS